MEYIGEHLLPGQIGEFFIALAFSAAIFSRRISSLMEKIR
jgi:hypothetical protein